MFRKLTALLVTVSLAVSMVVVGAAPASAATYDTIANSKSFDFKGSMSEKVLRSYCAHAVTLSDFCVVGVTTDPQFEEDLRMVRNTGAKFIGRTASYSWSGSMSAADIVKHFQLAKQQAAAVHKADPQIILQAGVFEIAYKATVNNTPIPAYVFEAFGLTPEKRNFRFDDIAWKEGDNALSKEPWGRNDACVPNITSVETQMYFYYAITRYIDAGFESIHLGQAVKMANGSAANYKYWDKVTQLGREYAKTHARRGVVLFDAHTSYSDFKIGDRLITDIYIATFTGVVDEKMEDDAQTAQLVHYSQLGSSAVGRAPAGQHPLGFYTQKQFTIIELDNHGPGPDNLANVATPYGFWIWGYDEITWFARQPEWYRNRFLAESQAFLATDKRLLDENGDQTCFIQFSMKRVTTAPYTRLFYVNGATNIDTVLTSADRAGGVSYTLEDIRKRFTFNMADRSNYYANTQSEACPFGSNQEVVIKAIFAGKAVDEALFDHAIEEKSAKAHLSAVTTKTTQTTKKTDKSTTAKTTVTSVVTTPKTERTTGTTMGDDAATTTGMQSTTLPPDTSNTEPVSEPDAPADTVSDVDDDTVPDNGPGLLWLWILIGVVVAGGAGVGVFLSIKIKKAG